MSLGNSITTILQQFLGNLTLVPKALFSSLHSFTKHSAFTSSPIVTKALLPTLSLSLSADTNQWRKLNFCTTTGTLPLTVVQPITTLAAVLEAHFGSFRILFANSPRKVSRREISCSVSFHSRTAKLASRSSPQQHKRTEVCKGKERKVVLKDTNCTIMKKASSGFLDALLHSPIRHQVSLPQVAKTLILTSNRNGLLSYFVFWVRCMWVTCKDNNSHFCMFNFSKFPFANP